MKRLLLLLGFLLFMGLGLGASAQSVEKKGLTLLSKDFQRVFRENGWILDVPLNEGGLIFTDGIVFYRIKDSVSWVRDHEDGKYRLLDSIIVADDNIQDSIVYMILGVHDKGTQLQIVDIYRYSHVAWLDHAIFPNPGVRAEFRSGISNTLKSLSVYLDSVVHDIPKEVVKATVYFSGVKPYSLMRVSSKDKAIKEALVHYFNQKSVGYIPPLRFGRPMYSTFVFDIKKMDNGFVVDYLDYAESFFCYDEGGVICFIEPLHEPRHESAKGELSFVYDEKWTEEEFLASRDIVRIMQQVDPSIFLNILKSFRGGGIVKPFSARYVIWFEKK